MKLQACVAVLVCGIIFSDDARAEFGVWNLNLTDNEFQVELSKPTISDKSSFETKFTSVFTALSIRYGSRNMKLITLISHYTVDYDSRFGRVDVQGNKLEDQFPRSSTFGNPYVGIQFLLDDSSSFAEIGAWLPLMSNDISNYDAQLFGLWAHPLYIEPVLFDGFSARGFISMHFRSDEKLHSKIRIGGTYIIPDLGDAELFADYTALGWIELETFKIGAGLNGRAIVTEGDLDFSQRTAHEIAVFGQIDVDGFMPGLRVRFPLDANTRAVIPYIIDLQFSVAID